MNKIEENALKVIKNSEEANSKIQESISALKEALN